MDTVLSQDASACRYLETYKMELLMRKYRDISGDTGSGTTPAGSSYEEQPPHKKPRIDYGPPVLRQLAPKQKGPSGKATRHTACRS